jgi:hypothetical protein
MSAASGRIYVKSGSGRVGLGGNSMAFRASPKPEVVRRSPGMRRASRPHPTRTPRSTHGPPGRPSAQDEDDPDGLVAALAAVLSERGPLPGTALARAVGRRTETVLAALGSSGRFTRSGRARATRWDLKGFDAAEAASHWKIPVELAEEFIHGEGGLVELGLVASVNGNGRVAVTELGLELSWHVASLGPLVRPQAHRLPGPARLPAPPATPVRGGVPAERSPHA